MSLFNDRVDFQIIALWFIFNQINFDKRNIDPKEYTTCRFHYLLLTIYFLYLLDNHHQLILWLVIFNFIIVSRDSFVESFKFFTTKITSTATFSKDINLILNDTNVMPLFWEYVLDVVKLWTYRRLKYLEIALVVNWK